jgi:hypothetical protein
MDGVTVDSSVPHKRKATEAGLEDEVDTVGVARIAGDSIDVDELVSDVAASQEGSERGEEGDEDDDEANDTELSVQEDNETALLSQGKSPLGLLHDRLCSHQIWPISRGSRKN